MGATKRPVYRIVVADSRSPRDGRFIEAIGFYDPLSDPAVVRIDEEKVRHVDAQRGSAQRHGARAAGAAGHPRGEHRARCARRRTKLPPPKPAAAPAAPATAAAPPPPVAEAAAPEAVSATSEAEEPAQDAAAKPAAAPEPAAAEEPA